MSFPFVRAKYYSVGRRKPDLVLAAAYHMAEGYGTVSWLTHPSSDNSSTLVVEKTGRVIQMVKATDMDHSLHVSFDPDTNDAPDYGIYGNAVASLVLRASPKLYNNAVVLPYIVSIEVEGFAKYGPNLAQTKALRDVVAPWVRETFPNVRGNLGHRDFQDYKACPGGKFPWAEVGGHGLFTTDTASEAPVRTFTFDESTTIGLLTHKTDRTDYEYLKLDTGNLAPVSGIQFPKLAIGPVRLTQGIGDNSDARSIGYLIESEAVFILATQVASFTPRASGMTPDEVQSLVSNAIIADRAKATIEHKVVYLP